MSLVSEIVLPIALTEEKRRELKSELSEVAITLDRDDEILAVAKNIHKAATMMPKKRLSEIKKNLRQGFIEERRRVHEYINEEDATIEYTDAETGEEIYMRYLTMDERTQYQIPFNAGRNKKKKKASVNEETGEVF